MKFFSKDYTAFFEELSNNNNKEWFDENRDRYKKNVKEPFEQFIEAVISFVHADNPKIAIAPKDAIFRINRDIRFSNDKTPYKTHMGAVISPIGRKDYNYPGLYVEVNAEGVKCVGGVYKPDTKKLKQIREYIMHNMDEFNTLLADKDFKKKYGTLRGEQAKRLPKEFQEAAEQQPLMYNKNFYYLAQLPQSKITSPKLLDTVMEYYLTGKPMSKFFIAAQGLE